MDKKFEIIEIIQNNEINEDYGDLILSYLLGDRSGLSNFSIDLFGDHRAFGLFENDPFSLGTGVALSSGRVIDLVGPNTKDGGLFPSFEADLDKNLGENFNSDQNEDEEDFISLIIGFDVDQSKDLFYFQYVFGSEEFLEYGDSSFNDSFELLLNGVNYAELTDGKPANINNLVTGPEDLFPNPSGELHPDLIYNPVEEGPASDITRLDGFTRPLLYEAPLNSGSRNRLEINIRDVNDARFDSAVFVKADTLGTKKPYSILGDGLDGKLGDDNEFSSIPELIDLTGFDDVVINFTLQREAAFDNFLQFYRTDANGQVDGLLPGDPGYEEAVAVNLLEPELFVANGETKTVEVAFQGGSYYAPTLIIRGDLNNLATIHDAALGNARIQRNEDIWGFEDLTDNDFNDLVMGIESMSFTLL